jgi:hypothetical protein
MTAMPGARPFAGRLEAEGRELAIEAPARGVRLRLLGGVGIRLALGERFDAAYAREYRDLDLLCGRRDGHVVEQLLAARGWAPAVEFNALNGARRLLFGDPLSDAQVDVFVGEFSMCHVLPLADGLDAPGPALPVTDLLMTKLQIVELNAKDRGDLWALLTGGAEAIEPARVAALTARDWGLHHTCELNLAALREELAAGRGPAAAAAPLDALVAAMDAEPKSRAWKLRAKLGERKRWYEVPEEIDRA